MLQYIKSFYMATVVYSTLTATVHTLFYVPDICQNSTIAEQPFNDDKTSHHY